jgi:hypothetical protein
MVWSNFKNYEEGPAAAFESLMNHLFERYTQREFAGCIKKFRVVNGKGGDGGVEAYAELTDGHFVAVQSKWFTERFGEDQIKQIRSSVTMAMKVRPEINEYIICMPIDLTSLKVVGSTNDAEGNATPVLTVNSGDQLITSLEQELKAVYPSLTIKWWLDHDIETELGIPENIGIYKFWFDKEVLTNAFLKQRFEMAKAKWLGERYVPQLHALGYIEQSIDASSYGLEYRKGLTKKLSTFNFDLRKALSLGTRIVVDFNLTPEGREVLQQRLGTVERKIKLTQLLIEKVKRAEIIQAEDLSGVMQEVLTWPTKTETFNHDQELLAERLNELLASVSYHGAQRDLEADQTNTLNPHKVFLGKPGSGKTHALSHATQVQLEKNSPAVIVQAFGTDDTNWGAIMESGLITNGWSMDELFNALETQAIREDRRLANASGNLGDELLREPTKVLICVDGLEEATGRWEFWKQRIKECQVLSATHKRLLFIFSSREYFFNEAELKNPPMQIRSIPDEGDVPYQRLVKPYFKEYDITISSAKIIRGIDSLFALRLFCLAYQGKRLNESSNIVTAAESLLGKRINTMEPEFAKKIGKQLGTSRRPIGRAIQVIADVFINSAKIEHDSFVALLTPQVDTFLNGNEIDLLVDYLAQNGVLIKTEKETTEDGIPKLEINYSMTYRSIPELVIATRVAKRIVRDEITNITDETFYNQFNAVPPNRTGLKADDVKRSRQRIRQEIANILFHEHGKLVGENGFLDTGLTKQEIFDLNFGSMIKAPERLATMYKDGIDKMFFGSRADRMRLLSKQLLPASNEAENNFGARYLHDLLSKMPSAYARDQIWQGKDSYEGGELSRDSLRSAILGDSNTLRLSSFALHDEKPLIYAWCLSTLDQPFRSNLRTTLTEWALGQPLEFAKLIALLFKVADPQIQEDLGSICLGLAGRLKQSEDILAIAKAALETVFADVLANRNVIVRAGFRAMVERAYQFGLLTAEEVELARPKRQLKIELLNLDKGAAEHPADQIYPIVHDLSWYVIERSYSGFLKYPDGTGPVLKDQDSKLARELLDQYRKIFPGTKLFAKSWAMAAAIGYMRSLGFDRVEGSGSTEESHGARSKQFTYEEKYTWLAVSFLKGYLADYVPYENHDEDDFVDDYFKIVHVPNPGEVMIADLDTGYEAFNSEVLQESLVSEFTGGDIAEYISSQVTEEPQVDFAKWLYFRESQFYLGHSNDEMVTLYNDTTQKDAHDYIYARLQAIACFVPSEQKQTLIDLVAADPERLQFSHHMEGLMTSPDTDTYANPSDIVWMNWIEEYQSDEEYVYKGNSLQIMYALVKIASTGENGESHYVYPSKTTRSFASIVANTGNYFYNVHDQVVAYHQDTRTTQSLRQEVTLINRPVFEIALKEAGYDMVWFVHLYKSKEHGDALEHIPHVQRSRKYLVYRDEDDVLQSLQFWNERTSNVRDRFSWERLLSLEPVLKSPSNLNPRELEQIKRMIIAGGEVSAANIDERLAATKLIAFFETDNQIIATASIKVPLKSYKDKVFKKKAKTTVDPKSYEYELGYLYTLPLARGKNLSNRLISSLLLEHDGAQIFSTTRMGNMQVHAMMRAMGFVRTGGGYLNANKTDHLVLYITTVDAATVPTEFKIN